MINPKEVRFTVHNRIITALQWGEDDQPLILALHGWLDNAESYYKLAPQLSKFRVVAIDMAGHGQSDWRSADSGYPIWGMLRIFMPSNASFNLRDRSLYWHTLLVPVSLRSMQVRFQIR